MYLRCVFYYSLVCFGRIPNRPLLGMTSNDVNRGPQPYVSWYGNTVAEVKVVNIFSIIQRNANVDNRAILIKMAFHVPELWPCTYISNVIVYHESINYAVILSQRKLDRDSLYKMEATYLQWKLQKRWRLR